MRWHEHARGVGGLLGRMQERREPGQTTERPQRIDRGGARRLMISAGDRAGSGDNATPAPDSPRGAINHTIWHAAATYVVVVGGLMVASVHGPQHAWSSSGLLGSPPDSGAGDKESRMITKMSAVGVVSMVVASQAVADGAVQWRVEDGGNGHWYRLVTYLNRLTWFAAESACESKGSHLVTISSISENAFIRTLFNDAVIGLAWVGAYQLPNDPEPNGFRWITGEVFDCVAMQGYPCNFSNSYFCQEGEDCLHCTAIPGPYLDFNDMCNDFQGGREGYVAEWDADCNHDGVVDYGQIVDGTLTDMNGNDVPDCCDQGTSCSLCTRFDLNLNGSIDGSDLGVLLAFWGTVSPAFPRADINGDGNVDGADLGMLLANWGPCPN
ncbi:MAG: hypothetical protein EBU31_09760 [Proteobacteria bacterium]|nr:hypothetical protein [Pseudomonadota bacterium]